MRSAETRPPLEAISRSARRGRRGFTLLEVLAAVAILGIWYVVIAGASIQGLRREGESRRRIEASLIADRQLADIEAGLYEGDVPENQDETFKEDDFAVRVRISPLMGAAIAAALDPAEAPDGAPSDLLQLIGSESPGLVANLRAIRVEVMWQEGAAIASVTRETFAFDLQNVRDFIARAKSGDEDSEKEGGPASGMGDRQ